MTRTLTALVLAATYLAALGHRAPADLVLALLLGATLAWTLPGPRGMHAAELVRRAAALPRFALGTAASVLRGTGSMLLVVLGLRTSRNMGVVEVPIGARSDLGITVTGLVAILSPGSIFVGVDRRRGMLAFHVIDASDPEAIRAQIEGFYERHQRHVFP
jgi:multicomponent K+:H+ antiporter subunit E/multicomponent Na+:H+ antiporter subunit E